MAQPGSRSNPAIAPYGAWESPITAEQAAAAGRALDFPTFAGGALWWAEGRPAEGGRITVATAPVPGGARPAADAGRDVLPAPWSARSRVHEYGGRAFLPVPAAGGLALVFASWADQRLYRLDPGSTQPVPLTPEPAGPAALRYADLVAGPDPGTVLAVRERHAGGRIDRHVVAVPVSGAAAGDAGAVTEVVGGSHFLASPRVSPDGRHLAWIAWEHPDMPWDATVLRVGDLGPDGTVLRFRDVVGGPGESVLQPEWAGPDLLYAVSDRTGWWNLYAVPLAGGVGHLRPLAPAAREFGFPLWELGQTQYAVLADGRIAALRGGPAGAGLVVVDPASGAVEEVDSPYTAWSANLATDGERLAVVAGSPSEAPGVVVFAPDEHGALTGATVRAGIEPAALPAAAYLPTAERVTLAGPAGRDVHATLYRPRNPGYAAPAGERPPLVVAVHGGPTGQAQPVLRLGTAYFTSRGLAVVEVNYGGSAGFGRAYRERLRGQWGVVDVEDCVAAATALAERGAADPARLAIRGGSAGGWTVLAAVATTHAFACGASYFGVAELLHFVQDTHDFESRYIDGLVGPLPEAHDLYVERAPLSHVADVACPVLLLQGLEDKVVPPSQAEMFRDALAKKGVPHAYPAFEGEQHGFRKAETVATALRAELSFYGQVMGFSPPGIPTLALSTG